jgi:hypothetical protein
MMQGSKKRFGRRNEAQTGPCEMKGDPGGEKSTIRNIGELTVVLVTVLGPSNIIAGDCSLGYCISLRA